MATVDVGTLQAILRLRDDLSAQMSTAQKSLQSFGASATRIGAGLSAGLTLPIAAVGTATIKAAMDAVESENLVRESFQGMTQAAVQWSEGVSDAVGANSFKLRENAASMFLLAQNMGSTEKEAFDVATSLTELAGDLDSFLNLSAKGIDPIRALQSGLVGNTEALRSLNVFVNQATLQQIAYEHGLAETGEQLTQQQKFLATYIAIMDQTSVAQGDLARTLDSPTNQMRVMREQVTQLSIEFGTALLPVFTEVLGIVRDNVIPALRALVEWFTGLSPETQKIVVVMTALAAALGPVLVVVGQLAAGLGALIPLFASAGPAIAGATGALGPFAAIVAAIAGGAALGMWLRENSELFRGLTDAVGDAAAGVFEFFREAEKGTDVTETWTDAQKESLEQFKAMQRELLATADATEETTQAFREMRDKVVGNSYIPEMLDGIRSQFSRLDRVMLSPVRDVTRLVENAFRDMGSNIGGIVGDLVGSLGGLFGGLLGSIAGDLASSAIDWLGGLFRDTEEEVNDLRDAFFAAHGGFIAVQRALVGTIGAVEQQDFVKQIFDAETVEEFNAAVARTLAAMQDVGSIRVPPIRVPVKYDFRNVPNPRDYPAFQHGSGGFRNFGTGTPAILHGVERVQTRGQAVAEDRTALEVRKLRSDLAELPRAVGRSVRDAIALTGR